MTDMTHPKQLSGAIQLKLGINNNEGCRNCLVLYLWEYLSFTSCDDIADIPSRVVISHSRHATITIGVSEQEIDHPDRLPSTMGNDACPIGFSIWEHKSENAYICDPADGMIDGTSTSRDSSISADSMDLFHQPY